MSARVLVVDDSPTIRKVVTRILERHHYQTLTAADGFEALELLRRETADLVLVDFVMPRMNGYQLCQSVRRNVRWRELPVVLMSAKGDKIRTKFVQQTGALDAITKPFDARALLAVVESALGKVGSDRISTDRVSGVGSTPPGSESLAPSDASFDSERDGSRLTSQEPLSDVSSDSGDQAGLESAARLGQILAELVAPVLGGQASSRAELDRLASRLAQTLGTEAIMQLMSEMSTVDLGAVTGEILSGDLGSISIAEILQLLSQQKKTGALTLHSRQKRVTLYMRDGCLDFAVYAGLPEEFLIGRYLADQGQVDRKELDTYVQESRHVGAVLGDYLIASGVLDDAALTEALERQSTELLYEVVRWRQGRFRFVEQELTGLAARARLGLGTMGLVMEGFRRVDEWRLIEDSFDFSDILQLDPLAIADFGGHEDLTPDERRVLDSVDGMTSVGEIIDELGGSSFESCKVLYRLVNARLVRRRAT